MNKKGDVPFWLVMTILVLVVFVILVVIVTQAGGYLQKFVQWMGDVF